MKCGVPARVVGFLLMLQSSAAFAAATPYPPYPGAVPSLAYKVSVDGQPVFVHQLLTYDQFQWMDHASFSMTGKVHVEITCLVSDRKLITCNIRPLAYNIQSRIEGNKVSFDLDQPRYLVIFFNDEPAFYNTGLLLFAEPPEKNPVKLGEASVVNIMDYKIDNTGKTVETAKINQAISEVSAKPGGGTLFFPKGVYKSGNIVMKSNVRFYVDVDAVILGSTKAADCPQRAFVTFTNCENASLEGRGTFDMQGYPDLWHDFQPDTGDGKARELGGKVIDPHQTGIRGYVVTGGRNVSFSDLMFRRGCYHNINVSNCENFSNHNIKIVNRKQQYHDDAYNISGNNALIENGFAMTMDDTWALHGRINNFVVKGFVNYSYTCSLALGYGGVPVVNGLRLEDCHFVSNHNKFAIWIQSTPAYFVGRGYPTGARGSPLDDLRIVNCSFESDGGQIYIDGGDQPLTNLVFENCTFEKPSKPGLIMGSKVGPILFKNVKMNGTVIHNADELIQTGLDLSVPVKFEP